MKERINISPIPRLQQLLSTNTEFAGNKRHLEILNETLRRRSPLYWNQWRKKYPRIVPDLRGINLTGRTLRALNFARIKLDNAILTRADLTEVKLENASLQSADLRFSNLRRVYAVKANLSSAKFQGATLYEGDFSKTICLNETSFYHANLRLANFTSAKLIEADLTQADLTGTVFDFADLSSANLNEAIMNETSFLGAKLREASVAGTFIRRVKTDKTTDQRALNVDVHVAWDAGPGRIIRFTETDDIRLAQFHEIIDEQGSVANLISAGSKRVVLILGRFLPRRKFVLNQLAEALRNRGKVPVIFDFPGPNNRELGDTVRFIAGMSQFIVVDLTKASSVPLELQTIIPDLMIPVLPIIKSGEQVFSMFSDLQRRYFWIQQPVSYTDAYQLVKYVDSAILDRVENAEELIRERRAISVRQPVNVLRINRKKQSRRNRKSEP